MQQDMNLEELREYLATLQRQLALAIEYGTPAVDYLQNKVIEVTARISDLEQP